MIKKLFKFIFFKIKYKTVDSLDISLNVSLGKNVIISKNTAIDAKSSIGNFTYIGKNCNITKADIGRYCSIANNVSIGQGEHDLARISTSSIFYNSSYEKLTQEDCVIGNDVWIGTDTVILRGVKIGDGAVIGANSVVTKDVPSFAIVVGSPAKIIRYRFDEETQEKVISSKWWDNELEGGKVNNRKVGKVMKASFLIDFNLGNKIFDIADKNINRDNYAYFYFKLKDELKKIGIDLSTCDINSVEESEIVIKNGMSYKYELPDNKLNYMLALESPHVEPMSFQKKYHNTFKKIFTWNDDMIDNIKYFKVNYAFDIPKTIPKKFKHKKLCCTIAGNKFANHPNELYSKRVKFIRWFEKHHIDEFDLFGTGWNQYRFGYSFLARVLNKVKFLRKKDLFPSYKGMVESKFETMKNYKFSICYENIKEQNGYITEKIFDSFFAGCVPIYWGAKNVTEHIPKECFIDKREFESFEDIYKYIKNMDEKTYIGYLESIEKFLNCSKVEPFRAETFANTIVNEIIKDIHGNC